MGLNAKISCWKSPIFEGKLWVFMSYLSKMRIVYNSSLSSTFYSLLPPFFILEIFKFKYEKVFVRHSAFNSKFEWLEQSWQSAVLEIQAKISWIPWIVLVILAIFHLCVLMISPQHRYIMQISLPLFYSFFPLLLFIL